MYFIIVNPVAGRGRCLKAFAGFSKLLAQRGIAFTHRMTDYAGHASELAREALRQQIQQIIVMGGDGTVQEVAAVLVNTSVALCIYPAGSGNDLSRALRLPTDPESFLDMLTAGHTAHIDTGLLNGKLFCNVAGFGFDAEVIRQVDRIKHVRGTLAYLLGVFRAIATMRFHRVRIRLDDTLWEGEILLAAVCNGKCFGGGMLVSPHSDTSDGLFHVIIIQRVPRWWIPFLLPRFIAGSHLTLKVCSSYVCASVQLESEDPGVFQLDGQISATTPAHFTMAAASLRVLLPPPIITSDV